MKSTKWLALMAAVTIPLLSGYAQAPAAGAANISPGAAEVVKLAGSGVGDDVVLAYVQNSQDLFNLTADNVLYLRDVGVSQPVITAMLNHDSALHNQAPPQNPPPQNPPPQYAPTEAPPGPAPAPGPAQEAPPPQAVAAPASYVGSPPADVSYFYNDLAPYGTWVSLGGVGWCWQPSVVVVNRGWRPYCDAGHWVYTDAGWFWQSDYTWGWAAFHYGRWHLDAGCGWVWVPGRVWGPAWVTWRTVGTTCGWAPLPPGANFVAGIGWQFNGVTVGASFGFGLGVNVFAFVSFGNLCAANVAYHCLPPAQATVIFRQTTIVNNYTVVKGTVVNNGIAVNRIAAASHVPIPRATLREGPAGVGRAPGAGGAVVYRSPLKAPERPVHMVAQKVDAGHPYIQHTFTTTPRYEQKSSFGGSGSGSTFQHPANPALKGEQKSSFSGSTPTTTWQHTPTVQEKGRQAYPGGSGASGSAAAGANKYQAGAHETYQWQSPEKSGAGAQTYSAPKTYQGQTLNQDNHSGTGPKPAPTANPYSQGTVGKSQSGLTEESYKGAGQTQGSTSQGQASSGQTARATQSPHFYSPKTIEQSSQVRSLNQQPKAASTVPPATGYPPGSKKNQ
jgi:hypothetical protein